MRLGWLVTGPMAALLLLSAIPDILQIPDALQLFTRLGYPLLRGARRRKEWPPGAWARAALALVLIAGSYVAFRARGNRVPVAS